MEGGDGGVRATFGAATVRGADAPYDRLQFRVHYPARPPCGAELDTGAVAVDATQASLPVVVISGGVNCGPEAYLWLADLLAANRFAAVTYSFTTHLSGNLIGLIPEDGFGGPTSNGSILSALLDGVNELNSREPAGGALDLSRIALVGHSAGGRTALYLAADSPQQLNAVVALSAHVAERGSDGLPRVRRIHASCPVLICDGDSDGVIDRSRARYGVAPDDEWDPAALTFDALPTRGGEHLLARVAGGTHFTFVHPGDPATGRAFLEQPDEDADVHRAAVGALIVGFLRRHCTPAPDRAYPAGLRPKRDGTDELSRAVAHPSLTVRAR